MSKLRAQFYKCELTGLDKVELKIIGDPCDWRGKVTPEHVAQFPREWETYQQGKGEVEIIGTPLTDVPGITKEMAISLKLKGVRTAEELAALDEAASKGLGMGVMTLSKIARNMMAAAELETLKALTADAPRRGRPPKVEAVTHDEAGA